MPTEACLAYFEAGQQLPFPVWEQELATVKSIEAVTTRELGNAEKTLFLSCRSGVKLSIPDMMDTVLNISLNDQVSHK